MQDPEKLKKFKQEHRGSSVTAKGVRIYTAIDDALAEVAEQRGTSANTLMQALCMRDPDVRRIARRNLALEAVEREARRVEIN